MEQALDTLSAKELIAHYAARCEGKQPPKGLSKSALIAKINALPAPSAVEPAPAAPASAQADTAADDTFTVSGWAKSNGHDARELRKKLRASGLRAPYNQADVERVAQE